MDIKFEVVKSTQERDGKEKASFDLVVNGHIIGTSKTDSDARFHMYFLQDLLKQTWNEGYDEGHHTGYNEGANG